MVPGRLSLFVRTGGFSQEVVIVCEDWQVSLPLHRDGLARRYRSTGSKEYSTKHPLSLSFIQFG